MDSCIELAQDSRANPAKESAQKEFAHSMAGQFVKSITASSPHQPREQQYLKPKRAFTYQEWLISTHKLVLARWAYLFVCVMIASLLHPLGAAYWLHTMGFILSAVKIAQALSARTPTPSSFTTSACTKVQRWFAVFALLQWLVVCHMAIIGVAPAVHVYLDWATNLTTLVPQMLILDMPAKRLAGFLLLHTGAETAFYISVAGHSVPLAIIRASGLYALCAGALLGFRRRMMAAFQLYQNRQANQQEHSKSQLLFEEPSAKGNTAPAPMTPRVYRSKLQRSRVNVRIETPLMLPELPPGCIDDLVDELSSALGNCAAGYAVRSGCIVVSFNVCEPLVRQNSLTRQHLAGFCKAVADMARAWVAQHGLASENEPIPGVSVQVSDLISSVTAHPHTLGLPHDVAWSPSLEYPPASSLLLPFPALLLPGTCPAPAKAQGHQGSVQHKLGSSPLPGDSRDVQQQHQQHQQVPTGGLQGLSVAELLQRGGVAAAVVTEQQAHVQLCFEASICSPSELGQAEILGWGQEADSPEEDGPGRLRLLASVAGRFLPVHVRCSNLQAAGVLSLQVSVSLPASLATSSTGCALSLELWGGGVLLSCRTALLLPHACQPVLAELQQWASSLSEQQGLCPGTASRGADAEELHTFVGDLGEWLQFVGLSRQSDTARAGAQAAAGAQHMVLSGVSTDGSHLELMMAVGKDLLFNAVYCGMTSLAGMLLFHLMAPPFSMPFSSLTMNTQELPEAPEPGPEAPVSITACGLAAAAAAAAEAGLGNEADSPRPSPCPQRILLLEAVLSNSETMVAEVLEWGRTLGGPGFTWPWGKALGSSPSSLEHSFKGDARKQALLQKIFGEPLPQGGANASIPGVGTLLTAAAVPYSGTMSGAAGQAEAPPALLGGGGQGEAAPAAIVDSKGEASKLARCCRSFSGAEAYSAWLLTKYQQLVVRWAQLLAITCFLHLIHPEAVGASYCPLIVIMLLAAVCTAWAIRRRALGVVKASVLVFAVCHVLTLQQMARIGAAPAVHQFLDLGTSLCTYLPYMLVLDMSPFQLCFFEFVNIGFAVSFYLKVVKHSWTLAVLRAILMQAASLSAYAAIRRTTRAAFFRDMQAAKD